MLIAPEELKVPTLVSLLTNKYTWIAIIVLVLGGYIWTLRHENESLKVREKADAQLITSLSTANRIDQSSITALQQANAAWAKQASDNQQKIAGLQVAINQSQSNYADALKALKAKQSKDVGHVLNMGLPSDLASRLRDEAASINH
jgi:multidrug efflux pump subunit AcrA (membrane-fusion protein)